MVIKFFDYIEQIRNNLDDSIDNMCGGLNDEQMDIIIESYFKELKEKDYELYTNLIGMIFSDHYKLLKYAQKNNEINEEDEYFLDIYTDFNDIDDVLNYVDGNPYAIESFLWAMSDFNSYDYFEKREIWLSCKEDLDFLFKISSYNTLDYSYYCQKFTVEMFKSMYDDYTKEDPTLIGSFMTIKDTLQTLKQADLNNYNEVISDLLTLYYVIAKDEIETINNNSKNGKFSYMVKELENENINKILSHVDNGKYLDEILNIVFKNQDKNLNYDGNDDDVYATTIKKLKYIKKK